MSTTTVTVYSANGDTGKTPFAVYFAVSLARLVPQEKVLLVDFNAYSPNLQMVLPPKNGSIRLYLTDFLTMPIPIHEVIYQSQAAPNLYVIYSAYIKDLNQVYFTDLDLWTRVFGRFYDDEVRGYLLEQFQVIIFDSLPGDHPTIAPVFQVSDIVVQVLEPDRFYRRTRCRS